MIGKIPIFRSKSPVLPAIVINTFAPPSAIAPFPRAFHYMRVELLFPDPGHRENCLSLADSDNLNIKK